MRPGLRLPGRTIPMDDGLIFRVAIPDVGSMGFDSRYVPRTKPDKRMAACASLGIRNAVLPRFDMLVDLAMRRRTHDFKYHLLRVPVFN
jgi:hypothetical protein